MDMLSILILLGFGLGMVALFDRSDSDEAEEAPEGQTFRGSDADDAILGTAGDDRIFGNAGDDLLLGGPGDDSIYGGEGDDSIFAGPGNDLLRGGAGDDFLYSFAGQDTLFGDTGNDFLIALDGPDQPGQPDQLFGGFGNDTLVGDDGDTLTGGPGENVFSVVAYDGSEDPVIITDFDPARDELEIVVDSDGFPPVDVDDLVFVVDGQQQQVRVQLLDTTLAILENLTQTPTAVSLFREDATGLVALYRELEASETAFAASQS